MRTAVPLLATVILACAIAVAHGQQDDNAGPWQTYDTSNGEWRSYAGDIAGTKYSPLDQITAQNFSELEVVWEWTSVDTFLSKSMPGGGEWWAPLDAIVESLVAETPNLYRTGHAPQPLRISSDAPDGERHPLLQYSSVAGCGRRRRDG